MPLNHGFDSEADPGDVVGHSQDSARERGQGTISEFDPTVLQPSLTLASEGLDRV